MNRRHTITGQHSTRCISWATQLRIFVPVVHTHITHFFLHLYMFFLPDLHAIPCFPLSNHFSSAVRSPFHSISIVSFRFTYFLNYSKHFVQRMAYSAFVKRDGFFSHDIQYKTEISFILFHLVNFMQRHKRAKHVYTMTHVSICIRTATHMTNVHTHIRAIQALILFTRIYKFTNMRTRAK